VPSLSRFARLGRAKVVPVVTRMTPNGYEVQVLPAWDDFPSDDLRGDTALMNVRLQDYIDQMPGQYYWVHKRFKTRPPGAPPVY
jgi:Kdo2-lipid IVA lauroyltransferase/acyltransferase